MRRFARYDDDVEFKRRAVGLLSGRRRCLSILCSEICVPQALSITDRIFSQRWRKGRIGAARMGIEHGLYCVGCCWLVMALLFVGGIMNLVCIAGLAVLVLLEKLVP